MRLHRVVVAWSGPSVVGTAVNVLHFDATEQAAPPVAAVATAYGLLKPSLPAGLNITVPGAGDTIDDATGNLTGVWAAATPNAIVGTGYPNNFAGVGACVGWTTGQIVTGASGRAHKLRGRTFMVPLQANAADPTGTLADADLTNLRACAAALMGAGGLGVWHRPTTKGGSNGSSGAVISFKVRDKVAFLSSRRD
jgi:hypothetical protein